MIELMLGAVVGAIIAVLANRYCYQRAIKDLV